MRPRENFTPFAVVGLILTIATVAVFQNYIAREPTRIQADEEAHLRAAVTAGRDLYEINCSNCHGINGEGGIGPAINSRQLLKTTADEVFFSLTRTGIPGTVMPAWGQDFGGPFTDEQIEQLVAFIRSWEPSAPEIEEEVLAPDPVRGATIFATNCFVCHGDNGQGTEIVRALNDLSRLEDFDDAWYRATISFGRPAKGMPTWGTVLSPSQIDDLVALIGAWRSGQTVKPDISLKSRLKSALFAMRQFDAADTLLHLNSALTLADESQGNIIRDVIKMVEEDDLRNAKDTLLVLLPPSEIGEELFLSYCAACHGSNGAGGWGTDLNNNEFIQSLNDLDLITFLMEGRPGTAMEEFNTLMLDEQLASVVAFLRSLQE